MTLRIDLEQKTLTASVGALVRLGSGREIGLAGGGLARLWVGTQHHQRLQQDRVAEVPGYDPEVTVSGTVTVDDWTLDLNGRADGVIRDAEGAITRVEEFKTVHLGRELFANLPGERRSQYRLQLMLYALLLSDGEHPASAVLTLVDVVDGREIHEEVDWDHDEVEFQLRPKLRYLVELAEGRKLHRAACTEASAELPFPHPTPRPVQLPMMDAITGALELGRHMAVAAPTGVGKTAAALHPAVQHALSNGKRVYFLTAKNMQQQMAVETAQAMQVAGGPWRSMQLRAKGRMCAHEEMVCHVDVCPYAADYPTKLHNSGLLGELLARPHLDPDEIYEAAEREQVCPFEVSLDLLPHADVVVCDYNYVFDPRIGLDALADDPTLGEALLVIDEAHNLPDRARGYYSPTLSAELARDALSQCNAQDSKLFQDLGAIVTEVLDHIEAWLDEGLPGGKDGTEPLVLEPEPWLKARTDLDPLILRYVQYKRDSELWGDEDPLMGLYFSLVHFHRVLTLTGDEFVHLARRGREGSDLKILCLDASRFLRETVEASGGAVAMSATLEPFAFYGDLLGFDGEHTDTLSLPSPFPRENCQVLIAGQVGTTYRERPRNWDPIAKLVADMAPPGRNALVLFPSYVFLREIESRLDVPYHQVEVQRAGGRRSEQERLLARLREGTEFGAEPVLLLAVLGGMFAEGVDYPGEMLSQVVVVSPGLPQYEPERELLKEYYQQTRGNGFAYAYLVPGLRRVAQAAGRLIRSEDDQGVIVLVGRRFLQRNYAAFLPRRWYDEDVRELRSENPPADVRAFFGESHF